MHAHSAWTMRSLQTPSYPISFNYVAGFTWRAVLHWRDGNMDTIREHCTSYTCMCAVIQCSASVYKYVQVLIFFYKVLLSQPVVVFGRTSSANWRLELTPSEKSAQPKTYQSHHATWIGPCVTMTTGYWHRILSVHIHFVYIYTTH